MSGITGFIALDGAPADVARISAMLETLRHRGPDRQQAWIGGHAAFGHALLATTPEALAEAQPWVHPQTGCVVVCDSRLDNRPHLLKALAIEADPDTIGDGALLHAAWQRWGRGCADRLRGDFAFAIWDPRPQRLFCARDPMGVRPLYFHHVPGKRFVFGSSADAVLAHGDIDRTVNEGRIADFLIRETEGIDATGTFFREVQRLPPAHTLEWEAALFRQHKYWHPLQDEPMGLPTTDAEWIEAQREQLVRAVSLRLRSQHPVGSMLSGGLDSSSVVALASRLQQQGGAQPFPAISAINSQDPDCAETAAIRAVLGTTRSVGHLVDLEEMDALAPALLDWWANLGEPFDGSMVLGAAVYHAAAQAGVRSLMDGVPSDNLYTTAGYDHSLVRRGRWLDAWRVKRDYQAAFFASNRAGLRALLRLPGGLVPRALMAARRRRSEAHQVADLVRHCLVEPGFARRAGLQERYHRYRRNIEEHAQLAPDASAQSSLGVAYITAGIERFNRVASHFGIEPRPPFTDRDLITFQARVPWRLRLRAGRPKWILRQAMQGLLPPEVAWRLGKEHLGSRFTARLLRQLPPDALQKLPASGAAQYLDRARLGAELERWQGDATDPGSMLLPPVLLARWMERCSRAP